MMAPLLAVCRRRTVRYLLAVDPQASRGNVMGTMDILENDKYLDALFGLLLQ